MKTIGTKVNKAIYWKFCRFCEDDGVTVSDRLRDLVNDFIDEKERLLEIDEDTYEELERYAEKRGKSIEEVANQIIRNKLTKMEIIEG